MAERAMALGDTLGGFDASASLTLMARTATIESRTSRLPPYPRATPHGAVSAASRPHHHRAGDPHHPRRRQRSPLSRKRSRSSTRRNETRRDAGSRSCCDLVPSGCGLRSSTRRTTALSKGYPFTHIRQGECVMTDPRDFDRQTDFDRRLDMERPIEIEHRMGSLRRGDGSPAPCS